MKRILLTLFIALLSGIPLAAQSVPEISFDSADILKPPANVHLGEIGRVERQGSGEHLVVGVIEMKPGLRALQRHDPAGGERPAHKVVADL